MPPIRDLHRLLTGMQPELDPTTYVFARQNGDAIPPGVAPLGTFREPEGLTLILPAAQAAAAGLRPEFVSRRIMLRVNSDLEAVGLLARVSTALASAGIPANTVSAVAHDHLFVPEAMADRALGVLRDLESRSRAAEPGVVYSVTVRIDPAVRDEWLGWMRRVHIPAVLATGCFLSCAIQRQEQPAESDGRIRYVFDYQSPSLESLRRYQERFAPALQREHSARYAGQFDASRAIRSLESP